MSGELGKDSIPIGIQTTTLKAIEKEDHLQKHVHEAELFGIGKWKETTQESRFSDIPKYVPFMFGIGGGIHVLDSMHEGKPVWRTIKWDGDPAAGYAVGQIYFRDNQARDYAKITENPEGGWVWKCLEKEEQLSWQTGRREWEYIVYFPQRGEEFVSLNNDLNNQGWGYLSYLDGESVPIYEGLDSIALQNSYMYDETIRSHLVWDPDRAETVRIPIKEWTLEKENELKSEGWSYIEGSPRGVILARMKQDVYQE